MSTGRNYQLLADGSNVGISTNTSNIEEMYYYDYYGLSSAFYAVCTGTC